MSKPRILKTALANLTREMCENLYKEGGANKVYEYANKIKLQYDHCKPCDTDTPTISDTKENTCAVCGSNKYLLSTLKFTGYRNFNLIPIGNVRFSFKKRKGMFYVGDLHILHDTDVKIDADTYKLLMSAMKKAKTDLLTDGNDFFTTRGQVITQIKNKAFNELLTTNEDVKAQIHKLRFG